MGRSTSCSAAPSLPGRPVARHHRPARPHATPWLPFSASSSSPILTGGRPNKSPACFLIDSGEATVSSKGVQLATLGPGDYFGEIALIDGGPRSATVTAATDLVCFGLTFWEFRPLVEKNSAIAWKLLQAIAKRLRAAEPK